MSDIVANCAYTYVCQNNSNSCRFTQSFRFVGLYFSKLFTTIVYGYLSYLTCRYKKLIKSQAILNEEIILFSNLYKIVTVVWDHYKIKLHYPPTCHMSACLDLVSVLTLSLSVFEIRPLCNSLDDIETSNFYIKLIKCKLTTKFSSQE